MNEKLKAQLHKIVKGYPGVEKVMLFGSRAHGDFGETSDIDLAVVAPKLSRKEWLDFSEQVENELDTLLKIDLIRWEIAPSRLREEIETCHLVIV